MTRIKLALSLLIILFMSASCRELPLIGDLSGQWQITSIDYPDGTQTTPNTFFYCFYRHTAQLWETGAQAAHTANMVYESPDITLSFPRDNLIWLTNWGITVPDDNDPNTEGCSVHYRIEHLSSDRLVLRTDYDVTITCRKY